MNKLTKAQNKRFDERTNPDNGVKNTLLKTYDLGEGENLETYPESEYELDEGKVKQHLADELARQKKEMVEKLEREKVDKYRHEHSQDECCCDVWNRAIDQAIKEINEQTK